MSNTVHMEYNVVGLMSGTSLDGVDIAFCNISYDSERWRYKIIQAETIPYSSEWVKTLIGLEKTDAFSFQQTHVEYGYYIGQLVSDFNKKYQLQPDFISSHGHTIFHTIVEKHIAKGLDNAGIPKRITTQIGAGSSIAAISRLPVICDFRSLDVALGGQGAPLVPIGDELLFSKYTYCLNLGGFANISYKYDSSRIAYDICPVNIVMNAVCQQIGKNYDENGEIAKTGAIHPLLLDELNSLNFYQLPENSPKSLGKEWVIEHIHPLFHKYMLSPEDTLRTFCEHIAMQIGKVLKGSESAELLITGGGAYNTFLIECIKKHTHHLISIPDNKTIEFKEALIFAFLGVLRIRNEVNCLKSVTGAKSDNCGGSIYYHK